MTALGVKPNICGSLHDPTYPVGRLLLNVLGMIAEFESDLIRMRTREDMKVAKAKGRLRGKQPKLNPAQEPHLVELWHAGRHASARRRRSSDPPAPARRRRRRQSLSRRASRTV